MQINLKGTFTIEIQEENGLFVGYVKDNHISSFGNTKEEALRMTEEALILWIESQLELKMNKLHTLVESIQSVKTKDKNIYTVKLPDATSILSERNLSKAREDMICA